MRRGGFTLIEMIVVVFVMAALASIAAPSISSMIKASRTRSYLDAVERLPSDASQEARRSGVAVSLRADDNGTFQLEQSADANADPTVLKAVDPVPEVSPNRFATAEGEAGSGDWEVKFYPDGTSDRGGVEFDEGGTTWALTIDGHGRGTMSKSELPAVEDEQWPAGDYVHRS